MVSNNKILGNYITRVDRRNVDKRIRNVMGISVRKEFRVPTSKVNPNELSTYKIVEPGQFAFVQTTHNEKCFAFAYNDTNKQIVVSSVNEVFYVDEKYIHPRYLQMFLNRSSFDRYARFNSWGSAREVFSWDDLCDVEIEIPPINIQRKYVDIYMAMVANQQSYECRLEDLKLVCDAYIENISADEYKSIGLFIKRNQNRNQEKVFDKTQVKGFNNEGEFIKPMRLFSGDISTFKVIKKNDFVYNSRINSTIKKLSVALNEGDDLIVSPAYESFYICDTDKLDPYYLYMLLQREQFAKKVLFHSFGSSTLVFGFDNLGEVEIPIPDIQIQRAIANIYRTYKERKAINEKLKAQIKGICPILIRGSLEEGKA